MATSHNIVSDISSNPLAHPFLAVSFSHQLLSLLAPPANVEFLISELTVSEKFVHATVSDEELRKLVPIIHLLNSHKIFNQTFVFLTILGYFL